MLKKSNHHNALIRHISKLAHWYTYKVHTKNFRKVQQKKRHFKIFMTIVIHLLYALLTK